MLNSRTGLFILLARFVYLMAWTRVVVGAYDDSHGARIKKTVEGQLMPSNQFTAGATSYRAVINNLGHGLQ